MAWSRATRIGATLAGGVVVAGAVTTVAAAFAWRRATERRYGHLSDQMRFRRDFAARRFLRADVDELPAPVARYFTVTLREGQRRIRAALVRWDGEMRLDQRASWSRFTAEQRFTVLPPGFVWDAAVKMIPLVPVRVRDSYVGGEGRMLGRLGGVIRVVNEGATREMAESALVRWLGEAVWFPTALLPGGGVIWEGVDDSTARATVTDGATRVSADFHFAPTGEMTRMTAMRYRDVNGTGVLTPFEGRYQRFERRQAVMIPTAAEVAWLLPEGRFAYWRGRPTAVAYDLEAATRLDEPEPGAGQRD